MANFGGNTGGLGMDISHGDYTSNEPQHGNVRTKGVAANLAICAATVSGGLLSAGVLRIAELAKDHPVVCGAIIATAPPVVTLMADGKIRAFAALATTIEVAGGLLALKVVDEALALDEQSRGVQPFSSSY